MNTTFTFIEPAGLVIIIVAGLGLKLSFYSVFNVLSMFYVGHLLQHSRRIRNNDRGFRVTLASA
jgi:hypothetical protein